MKLDSAAPLTMRALTLGQPNADLDDVRRLLAEGNTYAGAVARAARELEAVEPAVATTMFNTAATVLRAMARVTAAHALLAAGQTTGDLLDRADALEADVDRVADRVARL